LQNHVGTHAQQRGSRVEADELRFDFANDAAVAADKLALIEQQSNDNVALGSAVQADTVSLDHAKTAGAMMLFGEKYPDPVRMVSVGDYSKELCGGTHVANTATIETIEIVSEESVSAGGSRRNAC
jgi:alanyl-tRNA synthetase